MIDEGRDTGKTRREVGKGGGGEVRRRDKKKSLIKVSYKKAVPWLNESDELEEGYARRKE